MELLVVSDDYVRRKLRFCGELTRLKYRRVVVQFGRFLGRVPVVADLQVETVLDFLAAISDGRSPHTVNEARAKLVALWNYSAKQKLTDVWPDVEKMPVPRRLPIAWAAADFRKLLDAAGAMPGHVGDAAAGDWWRALLLLGWATGERRAALLGFRWDDYDAESGRLLCRAETRKACDRDRLYQVPVWCRVGLAKLPRSGPVILAWPFSFHTYFLHWNKLLKSAGLPADRYHKTHALRRSHASHLAAAGVDASKALGHSSPLVTYEHYIDPHVVGAISHAEKLPDPTMDQASISTTT